MTGAGTRLDSPMIEPPVRTGDPWIDAYLRLRQAFLDGATVDELTEFAEELKRGLPTPTPPPPVAMFIHADILITCGTGSVSTPLITALWIPDAQCHDGW